MENKRLSFFVAGVQKAGTTSMFAYLRGHPALSPPDIKELHFFDDETKDWQAPNYADMYTHFAARDGERQRFDCTPVYSFWEPSLARMRDYNPQARLILLFRDPFERALSHWCMEYARGGETLPFAEAIRAGRKRLEGPHPRFDALRVHSYLERGRYGDQAARALSLFPREQLLFLRSEDLAAHPRGTLAQIAHFLDIAPFPEGPPFREHVRPKYAWPAVPTPADRALVRAELDEQIALFSAVTGLTWRNWQDRNAAA